MKRDEKIIEAGARSTLDAPEAPDDHKLFAEALKPRRLRRPKQGWDHFEAHVASPASHRSGAAALHTLPLLQLPAKTGTSQC